MASWVATVDEGAVRDTRDVDLLGPSQRSARHHGRAGAGGFVRGEVLDVVMFRDGAEGKPSEAVHLLFAGEKLRAEHSLPMPEIQTIKDPAHFNVIALESLLLMKLMSHRDKDKMRLHDLIGVRLIDPSWLTKLPPELATRLQHILDTPDA